MGTICSSLLQKDSFLKKPEGTITARILVIDRTYGYVLGEGGREIRLIIANKSWISSVEFC